MPQPPLDEAVTLERLAAACATRAADEVEIAVTARAGEYTRFAGERVHQPQAVTEVQLMVRAVVDGHPFRVATSVLRDLDRAVREAAGGARARAAVSAGPGHVELAVPDPRGVDRPAASLLWFDDAAGFDTATRTAAAHRAMADALAAGGEAAGMLGSAVTQQLVVTSTGVHHATVATEASGALTVTVGDGTAHWVDVGRSAARLLVAERAAETIAQARAGRGRIELPPGHYRAVLGPEATAELLAFLPDVGFGGALAAAGVGITARSGERVAPAVVDVADDALADVGLPIGFDIEGVPKQRVPFLDHGRVGRPVTDLATARTLGTASTGHAHIAREQVPEPTAANLVMAPGAASESDLIASVERGVYLQRFWYTRLVDAADGSITGVTRDACFLIEDGRLTRPLAGMRFTESVLGVLARVEQVGDAVRSLPVMNVWNGVTSAPALLTGAFRLGAAPLVTTASGTTAPGTSAPSTSEER